MDCIISLILVFMLFEQWTRERELGQYAEGDPTQCSDGNREKRSGCGRHSLRMYLRQHQQRRWKRGNHESRNHVPYDRRGCARHESTNQHAEFLARLLAPTTCFWRHDTFYVPSNGR